MGQKIGVVYTGLVRVYGRREVVEAYLQALNDEGTESLAVILEDGRLEQSINAANTLFVKNIPFEELGNLKTLFGRSPTN